MQTFISGGARAVVHVDKVVAGGAVLAGLRFALVHVNLTVCSTPTGSTRTCVVIHRVVARRSVETRVGQALVNVGRT